MSQRASGEAAFSATVVVPVKNGGKHLDRCLSAVRAQKTTFPFELLCIDSGSSDDSLSIIDAHGGRLYQIPPEEFGHGKTRNLGVSLSQTPFVAMITQDAVPAHDRWLEELITPFKYDDYVAGVFGTHLPHEDCRPAERYMLERHFATFGPENLTYRIGVNPRTWSEYASKKDLYSFFSDNNAALRKSVWELIKYPDVEFMEDQMWAAAVLEAGYGKAWAPRAAVRHSHNYDAITTFRRSFDESRFRRLYKDPPNTWPLSKWLEHARQSTRRDATRMKELPWRERLAEASATAARHHADAVGRFLGDAAPFLPRALVQRISQHVSLKGREDDNVESTIAADLVRFVRRTYDTRGTIDGSAELAHQATHVYRRGTETNFTEALLAWRRQFKVGPSAQGWWQSSLYRFLQSPVAPALKDRSSIQNQELTLNWVVPAFGEGGGGHLNIFRMIHLLEQRGIRSRVYVMDGDAAMPYPSAQLRSLVHQWYAPIEAPVAPLSDGLLPADFSIATHWTTAWAVRALGGALHNAYFVQDYEPLFHPTSSESLFAEQTYHFGFVGLAAGKWLGSLLREKYRMDAVEFPLAVDHDLYWPEPQHHRAPTKSVFAYIRPHTPRRAYEIVALALARVKKLRPQVEIHTAGAPLATSSLPFRFTGHGILNGDQLRRLYSSVSLGVAPSLTNYSLLPQEMAACGCPVIDLDGENTRAVYPKGAVVLAPPTIEGVADQVLKLLDDDQLREAQARRGLAYARSLSWDDAASTVEGALRSWATSPRRAEEGATPPVSSRQARS